jgi:hypothetical protein
VISYNNGVQNFSNSLLQPLADCEELQLSVHSKAGFLLVPIALPACISIPSIVTMNKV